MPSFEDIDPECWGFLSLWPEGSSKFLTSLSFECTCENSFGLNLKIQGQRREWEVEGDVNLKNKKITNKQKK